MKMMGRLDGRGGGRRVLVLRVAPAARAVEPSTRRRDLAAVGSMAWGAYDEANSAPVHGLPLPLDALSGVRSPHLICQVAKLVASHRDSIVPSADTANVKKRLHANDRSRPPHPRAALCGPARAARESKSTPSCKGHSFSAKSLRYDGTEHDTRRSARRQPPLRAGQRARADARAYYTSRDADAAADHDGPPRRRRRRDSGPRRGLRRRGVRRAGAHRGRRLARVPRRASGAFVAEPPARARSEALRDAAARLACVDAAPRPAARAARPPPPVALPRPPDRHHHRHRTGTAPRPPRRPTPTNSRRTPRARLHN